jgi:uncharacterized protein YdeI (YjbR/CyaY-like superfamily)
MNKETLSKGTVHEMPDDLRKVLLADKKIHELWEALTSLGRNEYICWVENAKMIDTRERRIKRTCEELIDGMKRPCCWIGCIHRTDKAISPSVQWVLDKKGKK